MGCLHPEQVCCRGIYWNLIILNPFLGTCLIEWKVTSYMKLSELIQMSDARRFCFVSRRGTSAECEATLPGFFLGFLVHPNQSAQPIYNEGTSMRNQGRICLLTTYRLGCITKSDFTTLRDPAVKHGNGKWIIYQ